MTTINTSTAYKATHKPNGLQRLNTPKFAAKTTDAPADDFYSARKSAIEADKKSQQEKQWEAERRARQQEEQAFDSWKKVLGASINGEFAVTARRRNNILNTVVAKQTFQGKTYTLRGVDVLKMCAEAPGDFERSSMKNIPNQRKLTPYALLEGLDEAEQKKLKSVLVELADLNLISGSVTVFVEDSRDVSGIGAEAPDYEYYEVKKIYTLAEPTNPHPDDLPEFHIYKMLQERDPEANRKSLDALDFWQKVWTTHTKNEKVPEECSYNQRYLGKAPLLWQTGRGKQALQEFASQK